MPRTISIFGDSISTFEGCNPEGFAVFFTPERATASGLAGPSDTWWTLLADALGEKVLANGSYSGSMVEGAGFPASWSPERIAAVAGKDGATPDDIVVFLGINDYGWAGARNQAAGRSAAMPPATDLESIPPAVAGMAPADAIDGFAQAYDRMLESLHAAYPNATIWCCTLVPGRLAGEDHPTFAWSLRGVGLAAYNEAIGQAAARHQGARLVDACALGLDYEAIAGPHPTARGMRQLAGIFLAGMAAAGSAQAARALNLDEVPGESQARQAVVADERWGFSDAGGAEAWASRDWCPRRACVGCPWAKGTGNAWYCVCTQPRSGF